MNKSVLVTGSYGQLGQSIYRQSNNNDCTYRFHDKDTLDLTDFKSLDLFIKELHPAIIINCAAYNAVDKAEKDIESAFTLNSDVPGFLARISHENNIRMIHISTDYVFDGKNHIPYTEEDSPNPQSMYGKSKLEGETKVLAYPEHTVIRTSWLYSEFGRNFVKTMLDLGHQRSDVNVVSDQVGTPTYAGDLANAILTIVKHLCSVHKKYRPGLYHYSNEGICSWYDFATEIMALAKLNCKVKPIESSEYSFDASRPNFSVMNKNKIKKTYQLKIPHWKTSLEFCLTKMKK